MAFSKPYLQTNQGLARSGPPCPFKKKKRIKNREDPQALGGLPQRGPDPKRPCENFIFVWKPGARAPAGPRRSEEEPGGLFLTVFGIAIIAGCSNNDDNSDFNEDLFELIEMLAAIEELAETSTCNDDTECLYIALGDKPCGGPWSYLIYSTSIDTAQLEDMVETYNMKQAAFNIKYDQVSDCAFVNPPTDVICENGACIAQF